MHWKIKCCKFLERTCKYRKGKRMPFFSINWSVIYLICSFPSDTERFVCEEFTNKSKWNSLWILWFSISDQLRGYTVKRLCMCGIIIEGKYTCICLAKCTLCVWNVSLIHWGRVEGGTICTTNHRFGSSLGISHNATFWETSFSKSDLALPLAMPVHMFCMMSTVHLVWVSVYEIVMSSGVCIKATYGTVPW